MGLQAVRTAVHGSNAKSNRDKDRLIVIFSDLRTRKSNHFRGDTIAGLFFFIFRKFFANIEVYESV